jgi:hypothetical protein
LIWIHAAESPIIDATFADDAVVVLEEIQVSLFDASDGV